MSPVPAQAAREVVVLGGGISGLSLAFFLRQALQQLPSTLTTAVPTRIRVLDAAPSAGGWVRTAKKDGFLFEEGPRGFRPSRNGAEMLRLVEQLGLEQEMAAVDPAAQSRYILRNGQVEVREIVDTLVCSIHARLMRSVLLNGSRKSQRHCLRRCDGHSQVRSSRQGCTSSSPSAGRYVQSVATPLQCLWDGQ